MRRFAVPASLLLLVAVPGADGLRSGEWVQLAHAERGPRVQLDHLELPAGAKNYEKYLRRVLRREASQVDWGAGAASTIQYRYFVEKLDLIFKGDVLIVKCSAIGRLPRGRTARSQLTFGGAPADKQKLVERVLTIVARGVLTRLSELERERRKAE